MKSKNLLIIYLCIAAIFIGSLLFFFTLPKSKTTPPAPPPAAEKPAATPAPEKAIVEYPVRETIGYSVQNRPIESYTFGSGKNLLIFIGGIHGGYEWNSTLLAYEFIDYFTKNQNAIPQNISISIIPSLNPDGLYKIINKTGRFELSDIPANDSNTVGRFNANNVDLNRNFDCNWKAAAVWRQQPISAGTAPFSEPESAVLKQYIQESKPAAAIFWHSQSNTIYGSQCGQDMLAQTKELMAAYSKASGYPAAVTFTAYEVTGDATDWLASINIPAITVELKTHQTIEWDQNLAGIQSLINYYKNK